MFFFSWKEQIFFCQLVRTVGFPLSQDFFNFQVPGLLDFFSPGTTGPRDLQGLQVPSCHVPGPSRDVPGRPGGTKSIFFAHLCIFFLPIFPLQTFFSSMYGQYRIRNQTGNNFSGTQDAITKVCNFLHFFFLIWQVSFGKLFILIVNLSGESYCEPYSGESYL